MSTYMKSVSVGKLVMGYLSLTIGQMADILLYFLPGDENKKRRIRTGRREMKRDIKEEVKARITCIRTKMTEQ